MHKKKNPDVTSLIILMKLCWAVILLNRSGQNNTNVCIDTNTGIDIRATSIVGLLLCFYPLSSAYGPLICVKKNIFWKSKIHKKRKAER